MYHLFACCIIGLITHHLSAEIITTDKLATIKEHYSPGQKTLIAFDIDNTIATMDQELGSDQWFTFKLDAYKEEGFPAEEAFDKTLQVFTHLNENIDLEKVENSPQLIQELKDTKNVLTIGLTARSNVKRTLRQLDKIGIHFRSSLLPQKEFKLATPDLDRPAGYSNGIVFCNGNNKGAMLLEFLKKIDYRPKKIIFVDDKMSNVLSVEKAVKQKGIEFVGIRYSRFDDKVKKFDAYRSLKKTQQFLQKHPIPQGPTPDISKQLFF